MTIGAAYGYAHPAPDSNHRVESCVLKEPDVPHYALAKTFEL